MTTTELAQVLFTTSLQPSEILTSDRVRRVIDDRLCACGGDTTQCAAYVAQEAGDHPEAFAARMRWAISIVNAAYADYRLAA
ncbi:hypothetical protein [Nonomuraea typhae]|uniref:hypothetical protein n=1 Tax=Nonomuraea typhae TaxID=2603600 RepID=UPI0012FA94F9|nr:hypothetical protein [Nonomuraea typhae]